MKLHKIHSIAALLAFLLSILLLPPQSYAVIRTVEGTVSKVSDGDTVQVITAEGTNRGSDYMAVLPLKTK
jgi:endonuclease YncB( thermonuclease family)